MPKQQPEIDVIIPVHGQKDLLQMCLSALPTATTVPYNVILVDDASPEPLNDLQTAFNTQLTRNEQQLGFAATCNKGLMYGGAPYVLFLNSDCMLQPGALDVLLNTLKQDPQAGIVAPLLVFPTPSPDERTRPSGRVQHAGIVFDVFGNPVHLFVGWDPANPKVSVYREMQAVTGAAVLVSRHTCTQVSDVIRKQDKGHRGGVFRYDYGAGTFDDLCFCFTVRLALGKKVIFQPAAKGVHYVGASVKDSSLKFNLLQNEAIFRARWSAHIVWDEYMWA